MREKVTRERVGEEMFKIMKGKLLPQCDPLSIPNRVLGRDPVYGVKLVHDHSLYDLVFGTFPPDIKLSGTIASSEIGLSAVAILRLILDPHSSEALSLPSLHPSLLEAVNADPTCRARLYMGAALTRYRDSTYTMKKKVQPTVGLVIKESLKLGSQGHMLDGIPPLFMAHALVKVPYLEEKRFNGASQRVMLGVSFFFIFYHQG